MEVVRCNVRVVERPRLCVTWPATALPSANGLPPNPHPFIPYGDWGAPWTERTWLGSINGASSRAAPPTLARGLKWRAAPELAQPAV